MKDFTHSSNPPSITPLTATDITSYLQQGGQYSLGRGSYQVTGPVVMGGDLLLRGEGNDTKIELLLSEESAGLLCPQGHKIVLRGLKFNVRGDGPSAMLIEGEYDLQGIVLRGHYQKTGIRFAGASEGSLTQSRVSQFKSGVTFEQSARGLLTENTFEDNEIGIHVTQQAGPILQGNTCLGNRCDGISYYDQAGGVASGNNCDGNLQTGIRVGNDASPTLENNTCSKNGDAGIAYHDRATGVARGNTCVANQQDGFKLYRGATPILEGNICKYNDFMGISYFDPSGGLAKGNTCEANGYGGIAVVHQANPILEGNSCSANQDCGIYYANAAAGLAKGNTCDQNQKYGIKVDEHASPTLEANLCRANRVSGIAYYGEASGLAKGNTCRANTYQGIQVSGQAKPTLKANSCTHNQEGGIRYFDDSKGLAERNYCVANRGCGIGVFDHSDPTLRSNFCSANQGSGIGFYGTAAGLAKSNICERNTDYGILVRRQSAPTLKMNFCRSNQIAAIAFLDEATGLASGNTCVGGPDQGFLLGPDANPIIEDNDFDSDEERQPLSRPLDPASMSEALRRFLERVEESSEDRLLVAQTLDPLKLEQWAAACDRLSEPDPRWAEFEQETWSQEEDRLKQLSAGTWPERWAAACNPHTHEDLLHLLSRDPVPFIAGLAGRKLRPRPNPLPARLALWVQPEFNDVMGYSNLEQWGVALAEVHQKWSTGQVSLEDALRFMDWLPEGWQDSAWQLLTEREDRQPELDDVEPSPENLLRYAPLLGNHVQGDVESDESYGLFCEEYYKLGIGIEIPIHPRFSDEELLAWLKWGAQLDDKSQNDWTHVVHFPLPDGYREMYGHDYAVYPGGSLMTGEHVGYCMAWFANSILELEGFPRRATGFELIRGQIEQVLPGHFALEWAY